MYVYAKDPYEVKYQFLINKWKRVGLKHCDQHKVFIQYQKGMQDVYKNIEYNLEEKTKNIAWVWYMITDNKPNLLLTESFIRERKLNILFSLQNHTSKYQNMLDKTLQIILLWKC